MRDFGSISSNAWDNIRKSKLVNPIMSLCQSLKTHLLLRLSDFEKEIAAFEKDENLWKTVGSIKNPSGNLALHIAGNIQHFLGATLLKNSYIRKRDYELGAQNVSKEELLAELAQAKIIVTQTMDALTDVDLKKAFPYSFLPGENTTEFYLMQFLYHIGYHLGQVNYLRRSL